MFLSRNVGGACHLLGADATMAAMVVGCRGQNSKAPMDALIFYKTNWPLALSV
jgi:hypothetical protein